MNEEMKKYYYPTPKEIEIIGLMRTRNQKEVAEIYGVHTSRIRQVYNSGAYKLLMYYKQNEKRKSKKSFK